MTLTALPLLADAVAATSANESQPDVPAAFDWAMTALCSVVAVALVLDRIGRAGAPSPDAFLSPWHCLLYAALAAILALIGMSVGRARASGAHALGGIPLGYELSLVGIGVFVIADFGHAAWHLTVGDSTPDIGVVHVLLTSALILVLGGPARATWRRAGCRFTPGPLRDQLPMLLSLSYVLGSAALCVEQLGPLGAIVLQIGALAGITGDLSLVGLAPIPRQVIEANQVQSVEAPLQSLCASPDVVGMLTPREQEVVALVAQGFTNRRIAEALTISERTAEGHVERIRGKLGYTSRAQIAAWAAQRGTVPSGAC